MPCQLCSVRDLENRLKQPQPKSERSQCPAKKHVCRGKNMLGGCMSPADVTSLPVVHFLVRNNVVEERWWSPSNADFFSELHFLGTSWLLPEHNLHFTYRAQGQRLPLPLSKQICQIRTPPGGHRYLNLPTVENLQKNRKGERKPGCT